MSEARTMRLQYREGETDMAHSTVHFRESGSGTSVICIHSSASSSSQWRALMSSLSGKYHAVAVDLYGYGKRPDEVLHPWCSGGVTEASSERGFCRVERSGSHGSSNPSGCCQPRDRRFHQQGPVMITCYTGCHKYVPLA